MRRETGKFARSRERGSAVRGEKKASFSGARRKRFFEFQVLPRVFIFHAVRAGREGVVESLYDFPRAHYSRSAERNF